MAHRPDIPAADAPAPIEIDRHDLSDVGQADLFGPENIEANADLRASVVGGEDSFLDGGFGKLRYGGDGGDTTARGRVASLDVAWKPQVSWNFSGLVSVSYQSRLEHYPDLSEAFLKFQSDPAETKFSAREAKFVVCTSCNVSAEATPA